MGSPVKQLKTGWSANSPLADTFTNHGLSCGRRERGVETKMRIECRGQPHTHGSPGPGDFVMVLSSLESVSPATHHFVAVDSRIAAQYNPSKKNCNRISQPL